VVPSKSNEKIGLCDLTTVVLGRAAGSEEMFYAFEFHKRKYLWEPGERKFAKVAFPVGESMGSYRSGKGLTSPGQSPRSACVFASSMGADARAAGQKRLRMPRRAGA